MSHPRKRWRIFAGLGLLGVAAVLLAELLGSFLIDTRLANALADGILIAFGTAGLILLLRDHLRERRAKRNV